MTQMGMKPSQKKINQMLNAMNKQMKTSNRQSTPSPGAFLFITLLFLDSEAAYENLFQLAWFKQEKRAYIIGVSLLLIVAFLQLIPPKIIGIIVDEIHQKTLSARILVKWLMFLLLTGF